MATRLGWVRLAARPNDSSFHGIDRRPLWRLALPWRHLTPHLHGRDRRPGLPWRTTRLAWRRPMARLGKVATDDRFAAMAAFDDPLACHGPTSRLVMAATDDPLGTAASTDDPIAWPRLVGRRAKAVTADFLTWRRWTTTRPAMAAMDDPLGMAATDDPTWHSGGRRLLDMAATDDPACRGGDGRPPWHGGGL